MMVDNGKEKRRRKDDPPSERWRTFAAWRIGEVSDLDYADYIEDDDDPNSRIVAQALRERAKTKAL